MAGLVSRAWGFHVGLVGTPDPHQSAAVAAAKTHFVRDGAARGRLIMPCGTGKSLTAYWIAEALKAKTILVAVPSLALVRQSLTGWTRKFLAHGIKPDWIMPQSGVRRRSGGWRSEFVEYRD